MNFDNKLNKFKIFKLQSKYKKITELIANFEKHINVLYKDFFIKDKGKINLLNDIFEINKTLNTKYNNYISELDDTINTNNVMSIMEDVVDNDVDLIDFMFDFDNNYENHGKSLILNVPLKYSFEKIKSIINKFGCDSIDNILSVNFGDDYKNGLSEKTLEIIDEIKNIVTVLSFNKSKKKIESFKWETPDDFSELDHLQKERILHFKFKNNVYKISLYFKTDPLSIYIKTCQINYPYLYNKKTKAIQFIENEFTELDLKFFKTYIRHDSLANLYCYDTKDYGEYFNLTYFRYLELINTSFINIMKEFVSKESSIEHIFKMIQLHLIMDDESNDIAVALIGLIKEKKTFNGMLYNFILSNLTYYVQSKLQNSENNLEKEIENLKSLSLDNVDYKKQLMLNKNIPETVKSLALEKIEEMKSMNNDYFKQITYVKTVINFPWSSDNDSIMFENLKKDTKKSKAYLEEIENKLKVLSYGHEEPKKLLQQIIGKWISNPKSMGTAFGMVGPPGVGKTLLAKSISKALDIPFAEITLGGQNDGEILHGHGYTYSGSQPGLIVKKMVDMGKSRCILYFDELDKACSKHGNTNEISSILIHLTDPNMNKSFQDRFFQGIDFPLDKVIMIFSYNDSSLIDPILLDRITEIKIKPYNTKDKLEICDKHIIPEIVKDIGLPPSLLKCEPKILEYIIEKYTNEAGVRGIKRLIEKICMSINICRLKKEKMFKKNIKKITINKKMVTDILKEPHDDDTKIHPKNSVGIINGLYATTSGMGGIIPIQIFKNFSGGVNSHEIKLTGNQGDVMKESVACSLTTALNYLDKNKKKYGIKNINEYLTKNFKYGFHVHTPSTSTPKDGPSAGCAFTSAFISLILGRPIFNTVGMTGEIELTGRITKIGGLEFKLNGSKKAGVKTVYVPKENEKDVEKIKKDYPKLMDKNFKVIIVEYIDDLIDDILVK